MYFPCVKNFEGYDFDDFPYRNKEILPYSNHLPKILVKGKVDRSFPVTEEKHCQKVSKHLNPSRNRIPIDLFYLIEHMWIFIDIL